MACPVGAAGRNHGRDGVRKLGEAGRIALSGFPLEGKRHSELRQARNRLGRESCRFEPVAPGGVPPLLAELQAISAAWLRSKNTREKQFWLGGFDRDYPQRFPLAVFRREDSLVGSANIWPSDARQECWIDPMRWRADARKGVMDTPFAKLMLWARDEGYQWSSLGMAPLSGFEHHRLAPLESRAGARLSLHGEQFYNLRGPRDFKEKFDPEWQPRYLAAPGGLVTPLVPTRIPRVGWLRASRRLP